MKGILTILQLIILCILGQHLAVGCSFHSISPMSDKISSSNRENVTEYSPPAVSRGMNTSNDINLNDDRAIAVRNVKQPLADSGKKPRYALVIGNSNYKNIPQLSNPDNDAFDMKNSLEQLGFEVRYLLNARSRRVMVEAVRIFGDELRRSKNTVGLFFYAGHAMQIHGINYLIPVEAEIKGEVDVEYEALNVNYLLQTMDVAKNDMNIIIMDSCRNNPYSRGFRGVNDRGLAPMDSPTGSIIVFATAPGKTAADGIGRNGTFTKHLLKNIKVPDLSIEQMLKQVRIGVIDETHGTQTPWETSSLRGDFCFAGCPSKASIDKDVKQQIEAKLRRDMQEEQRRLEKEWAALESEKALIEYKKLEMQIKAIKARQLRDKEMLEKIHKEQSSLRQQGQLLNIEQDKIEQQKAVLDNRTTNNLQEEADIEELGEEWGELKKEQAETEKIRQQIEKARERIQEEKTDDSPETSMTIIGF